MKIAIMGIRGIPANYGGFETLAEELAPRLVRKGHQVTVYGRSNIIKYKGKYYKGVLLKTLPTISHKYLDTVIHTFLCVFQSLFEKHEVILVCNAANSIFSWIPRIVGKKVVVNVDGIERRRKKWNLLGRIWYQMGEVFSIIFPNKIVSDARVIQEYYKKRYHKESILIPYGAYVTKISTTDILNEIGIKPNEYFLYVSRLEPENNAHVVIKSFEKLITDKKLLIVGDAPYAKKYIDSLKRTKDPRIIFTGFVFGAGYKELQSHAFCYIHATEIGGTHPALIEAMGFGNCVVANGTPENIEVVGEAGIIYKKNDKDDLRYKLDFIVKNTDIIESYKEKAQERVRRYYDWEIIVDKYEKLFKILLNK